MTDRRLSPIERLIGGHMQCVRCGAAMGKCDCWTAITLRCPQCQRTKEATRDDTDPPGTAVVEALCDTCDDGGGFPGVHYYDAQGRWFDGVRFRAADGEDQKR